MKREYQVYFMESLNDVNVKIFDFSVFPYAEEGLSQENRYVIFDKRARNIIHCCIHDPDYENLEFDSILMADSKTEDFIHTIYRFLTPTFMDLYLMEDMPKSGSVFKEIKSAEFFCISFSEYEENGLKSFHDVLTKWKQSLQNSTFYMDVATEALPKALEFVDSFQDEFAGETNTFFQFDENQAYKEPREEGFVGIMKVEIEKQEK